MNIFNSTSHMISKEDLTNLFYSFGFLKASIKEEKKDNSSTVLTKSMEIKTKNLIEKTDEPLDEPKQDEPINKDEPKQDDPKNDEELKHDNVALDGTKPSLEENKVLKKEGNKRGSLKPKYEVKRPTTFKPNPNIKQTGGTRFDQKSPPRSIVKEKEKDPKYKEKLDAANLKIEQYNADLITNCWKELTKCNPNTESIDPKQLLVFCAAVLGVYSGIPPPQPPKVEEKPFEIVKTEVDQNVNITEVKNNQEQEQLRTSINKKVKLGLTPAKTQTKFGVKHSPIGRSTLSKKMDKNELASSKIQFSEKGKKGHIVAEPEKTIEKKNILKQVIPDIDVEKYSLNEKDAKHYSISFHHLYDNRVNFIQEAKKQAKLSEIIKSNAEAEKKVEKPSLICNNKKTKESAEHWRKKCFEKIKEEFAAEINDYKIEDIATLLVKKKDMYNFNFNFYSDLERLRQKKKDEEIKSCTFKPKVTNKKKGKTDSVGNMKRLYEEAMEKLKEKKEKEKQEKEKVKELYSFKPEVHKRYSHLIIYSQHNIFDKNPLSKQEEKRLKEKIEKNEKLRQEKKLMEVRLKSGLTNLKKEELEEHLKDMDKAPTFNFSIEKKGYKNGIANRVGAKEKIYKRRPNPFKKKEKDGEKKADDEEKIDENKLLFTLDITIDEDRKETLELFQKDDPQEILDKFCEKFGKHLLLY